MAPQSAQGEHPKWSIPWQKSEEGEKQAALGITLREKELQQRVTEMAREAKTRLSQQQAETQESASERQAAERRQRMEGITLREQRLQDMMRNLSQEYKQVRDDVTAPGEAPQRTQRAQDRTQMPDGASQCSSLGESQLPHQFQSTIRSEYASTHQTTLQQEQTHIDEFLPQWSQRLSEPSETQALRGSALQQSAREEHASEQDASEEDARALLSTTQRQAEKQLSVTQSEELAQLNQCLNGNHFKQF